MSSSIPYISKWSIYTLKHLLETGDWLTNMDLRVTYFMVPIHSVDRVYSQFSAQDHHF